MKRAIPAGTAIVGLEPLRLSERVLSGLCLLIAIDLAIWALIALFSSAGTETTWFHVSQFIPGVQGADSWKPMEIARAYVSTHRSGLYEEFFFTRGVKFQ